MNEKLYYLIDKDESLTDKEKREIYFRELEKIQYERN